MRVFFIGNVTFSKTMLITLLELDKIQIVGIATKSQSSLNSDQCDLSPIAVSNSIPCKYVRDINAPHILDWIRSTSPDIVFCFGWSALIKKELLNLAPLGVLGYHPAELPKNRGRHPIIWALVLGLETTASTFFRMNEGADEGDILSQERISISHDEDARTLYQKITETAQRQLKEFVPQLINKSYTLTSQDLAKGNVWRKRDRRDGLIDFRMTSHSIYNLVRALSKPYPGAEVMLNGEYYIIWRSQIGHFNENNIEPGRILNIVGTTIEVKTGDASILLVDHEIPHFLKKGDYLK